MPEPDSYEFIVAIKRLAGLLHQKIDALLKPYDLARTQFVILRHLRDQDSLPTSELVARMQVEPATLSGLLDTLEGKGLIMRLERPEDKRRKDVRLTEAGGKLLAEIPAPGPIAQDVLLAGIDPEAAAQFRHLAWQMVDNLETDIQKTEGGGGV